MERPFLTCKGSIAPFCLVCVQIEPAKERNMNSAQEGFHNHLMFARQEGARCDNTRKKVKNLHKTKIKPRHANQTLILPDVYLNLAPRTRLSETLVQVEAPVNCYSIASDFFTDLRKTGFLGFQGSSVSKKQSKNAEMKKQRRHFMLPQSTNFRNANNITVPRIER